MQSFIFTVINDLLQKETDLINYKIILPNQRAGVFFKAALKKQLHRNSFFPQIYSIQEFIQEISKLELLDNTNLLFEFYKIYLTNTPKDKIVTFENFVNWSTVLLQDINEIDNYLLDADYFFKYLADIHRIENWFKTEKPTNLTKNYLNFFNLFGTYYKSFYKHLLQDKKGYQGLLYREASKKIDSYLEEKNKTTFLFVGFNALNKAEELIIKKTINQREANKIIFDIDQFFLDEKMPYAHFINKYIKDGNYFKTNKLETVSVFKNTKNIHVIGIPKNVSLIKETGKILTNINLETTNYQKTALVLANENLLIPALNSLPKEVEKVNITMGFSLKNIEISNLFFQLLKLHQNKDSNQLNYYYKDVFAVLKNAILIQFFEENEINTNALIISLQKNNTSFISLASLLNLVSISEKGTLLMRLLFSDWSTVTKAVNNCIELIQILTRGVETLLDQEYLIRFLTLFQQLKKLTSSYDYITNLKTLEIVFRQLLNTETLSFKGEPLSGLQIMGMLETRVLDFETVIITSVNEGLIPSGKKPNTFIPFDVKREFGIPTYNEKDAIYSYHFYRLIQRAKNIYLLYNTETDEFGAGEQSRFITQLEVLNSKLPNHTLTKTIVSPLLKNTNSEFIEVEKTPEILEQLEILASKGLSPSALTSYILNPIQFYKQKIVKIRALEEIEENIAANTFGTIIHNSLEELYQPFLNTYLTESHIVLMQKGVVKTVEKYFKKVFKNGNITTGKNLMTFEISKHYILTFLKQEMALIRKGKRLKILALEVDLEQIINIENISFPIKLRGQVDRIDELNDVIRIIDYKTGLVTQGNLTIKNWDDLTIDYKKYSKSFQVLFYAYMYVKANNINLENQVLKGGIVSFKNLNAGFLSVNKGTITNDILIRFEEELHYLIQEVYNPKMVFKEKESPFD